MGDEMQPPPPPIADIAPHVHAFAPNGLIREGRVQYSPVAIRDDVLWDAVYSIGLCPCGQVTKTHVANERTRTRAEPSR